MTHAFIVGSQGTSYATRIEGNKFQLTWTRTLTAFLHTGLWMTFGLIIWYDPANFGDCSPDSNVNALFWIFGQAVPITNSGLRTFARLAFGFGGAKKVEAKDIDIDAMHANGIPGVRGDLPVVSLRSVHTQKTSTCPAEESDAVPTIPPLTEVDVERLSAH